MTRTWPLAALLVLCVAALGATPPPSGPQQPPPAAARPLEFFDIEGMPLKLLRPELTARKDRSVLRGSAVNQAAEPLYGARLLIALGGARRETSVQVGWTERIAVEAYGMREVSLELPARLNLPRGGRLILAVEQVYGRETIWSALRVENALRAFARGESPAPEVRRISNQLDRP